ncbi:MAG: DUF222 domain-containing protein [Acidimicrobiia bacterium]|nr:HNH endonuclease [Acidimicrobiia bacterium]NNC91511.1 DUF222 domain-containing protein [Acidimicrobiia bacterium]
MELGTRGHRGDRPDAKRVAAAHTAMARALVGLLDLVPELETDEAYFRNAATDMVSWLTFDLGIAPRTARAWTRVGRSLVELPAIREALAIGAVSFDEVAVLCRFATPENEIELLELTRHLPQAELAAGIKEFLDSTPSEPDPADSVQPPPPAELRTWWDEDEFHLRGRIRGADGVLVEQALLRFAAQAPLDPHDGLFRDMEIRKAEALMQIASEALDGEGDHDRATVVVHVSADELREEGAVAFVAGKRILRDELLRLTCDGRVQPAIDDPGGLTVGVGRITRQIPAWLRRLLDDRDGGCRFPGCGRTRWTHGHHIVHWAELGPTNLDNLVTLCGFHHRMIHSQGWEIVGNPNGDLIFLDQWGSMHQPVRPPFPTGYVGDLLDWIGDYGRGRLQRMALANAPP